MEFKEQMKKQFIPAIEGMAEREAAHLEHMIEMKANILKDNFYAMFPIGLGAIEIESMIERSRSTLKHLQFRLNEYIEYANKL